MTGSGSAVFGLDGTTVDVRSFGKMGSFWSSSKSFGAFSTVLMPPPSSRFFLSLPAIAAISKAEMPEAAPPGS